MAPCLNLSGPCLPTESPGGHTAPGSNPQELRSAQTPHTRLLAGRGSGCPPGICTPVSTTLPTCPALPERPEDPSHRQDSGGC